MFLVTQISLKFEISSS